MTIKAVIFDLDGTLVDSAPDLMLATNHVLSRLERRAITMDEVRSFVGHGARALIARGCAATGDAIDEKTLDFYFAEFLRFYEKNIAVNSVAFPGVIDLLKRCAAGGLKMGVCTNKLEGLSVRLLQALDMEKYFGAIVGPDTINIAKPDPAPYLETVKRLGVPAKQFHHGWRQRDGYSDRAGRWRSGDWRHLRLHAKACCHLQSGLSGFAFR